MTIQLTTREQRQAEEQAIKLLRQDLERDKPLLNYYLGNQSAAGQYIQRILIWSKFGVVVIALFAAIASSIRTIQAASEIYSAAGTTPLGVILAAIAFTISVEGALFIMALAQEGEQLRHRASKTPRRVMSLKSIWWGIQVRIGLREPLRYDELPEGGQLSILTIIAFSFAVTANAYMGFRPMLSEIGTVSLQAFFAALWSSPATLQLTFLLDMAGILFPPLMALSAGHLTARFAAEIAHESEGAKSIFERDMEAWRAAYTDPLSTDEGKQLLERLLQERTQMKTSRQSKQEAKRADFLSPTVHPNGREHSLTE